MILVHSAVNITIRAVCGHSSFTGFYTCADMLAVLLVATVRQFLSNLQYLGQM